VSPQEEGIMPIQKCLIEVLGHLQSQNTLQKEGNKYTQYKKSRLQTLTIFLKSRSSYFHRCKKLLVLRQLYIGYLVGGDGLVVLSWLALCLIARVLGSNLGADTYSSEYHHGGGYHRGVLSRGWFPPLPQVDI
jgi:hypothetical protein